VIRLVFLFVCFHCCDTQRIFGCILGTGGINTFGELTGNFDKCIIFDTVVRNENSLHFFLTHLGDDFRCFRMIAAINDSVGLGPLNFLNNCGIIHCSGCNAFIQYNLSFTGFFKKFLGKFGKSFSIIAFIMDNGKFFQFQCVERKFHIKFCLGIVRSDRAVKIGVITTLRQSRIGGGWGHTYYFGILINAQRRFSGTAANMTNNHINLSGQ